MLTSKVAGLCSGAMIAAGAAGAGEQDTDSAIAAGAIYAAIVAIARGIITLWNAYKAYKAKGNTNGEE